ncbi:helix-turn-helix domain-containing protein [Dysgonomonas termitidis]|uniref:Helix-turn-helix domain-containing protein n=1 Tax=Dysgonomonas termitidis TaxID=1516126 RepID=A0ABV9KYS1_9BACT
MEEEFIMIKKNVFNKMLYRINHLEGYVKILCLRHTPPDLLTWLDTQQVCSILSIGPKALQKYRDAGKIGFSQVGRKNFYLKSDIEVFLKTIVKAKNKYNKL